MTWATGFKIVLTVPKSHHVLKSKINKAQEALLYVEVKHEFKVR